MAAQSRVDLEAGLRRQFNDATKGQSTMNFQAFFQVTGCRSHFFANKLFEAIDVDNSGDISFDEFVDALHILQTRDSKRRVHFIFRLFDSDGNGEISFKELREVLKASVEESNASLPEEEIELLADKLKLVFKEEKTGHDLPVVDVETQDEVQDDGEVEEPNFTDDDTISLEDFERVMLKYPDVLEGLSLEGITLGRSDNRRPSKKGTNFIVKMMNWFSNNPQLAFTYTLMTMVWLGLFFWRFTKYMHDCDEVDLTRPDPITGLSREQVLEEVNKFREEKGVEQLTRDDAKYWAFSKELGKEDPIGCQDARKTELLSWTLAVAKGSGQAMKGTFTLILFPVSRNLMTTLRTTFLRHVFMFDEAIEFHKLLGVGGFIFAWIHTLCHVVDVIRWSDTGRFKRWSWAFPDDDSGENAPPDVAVNGIPEPTQRDLDEYDGMPAYLFRNQNSQPTTGELLGSWFGVTGIILIVIYTIAALFAFDYPRKMAMFREKPSERGKPQKGMRGMVLAMGRTLNNFNYFWYTHHLFAIFYVAMLLHPLPHLPDERYEWGWSDSWLWVGIPVAVYLAERLVRVVRTKNYTRVMAADLFPGNVVGLKVLKPRGLQYTAGQYIFIKCPELSHFEWHPFTLTSSPGDNYLSVHIRAAGDWTKALYKIVQDYHKKKNTPGIDNPLTAHTRLELKPVAGPVMAIQEKFPFQIYVDGPFGAPAQDHKDYNVMILVGAGIGVTPFAGVLNDILDTMKKARCENCGHVKAADVKIKKVYFYWTVRLRNEAVWFKHLLEEIAEQDTEGILEINIHVTSIRRANDIRVTLLRLAQKKVQEQEGLDTISTLRSAVTHFGRPNWGEVFRKVKTSHPEEQYVGVFYCGPNGLANVLGSKCREFTSPEMKFDFMKESFG